MGVVHHPIVSTLSECKDFRLACFVLDEWVRVNFRLYVFHREFRFWNWADDAVVIAGRRKEYRQSSRHNNRV